MPTAEELAERIKKGERLTHEELGEWLLDIEGRVKKLEKREKKHGEN